uniref:Tyrosinase n=1 Tax=Anthurium amnicola TaxID=1678845 RepID=A0A1D1Y2Q2_9ARAE
MGEPNNTVSRGRKRKGSSKSGPKNSKRKVSTSTTDTIVKQEPITASPVSLPKNLELPISEIPQYNSSSNIQFNPNDDHPQQLNLETSISKKNLTDIPNEIFVQICANLHPNDLFSLTLVCKKLKGLLCSPGSKDTQAIWRTSRMAFMEFLRAPPPFKMDEKSYIVLKQLEKGCQFCREKNFVKVYWEFRVRCCELCLDENTMSRDKLFIDHCIPSEIFRTLPHIFRDASHYYWKKDVTNATYEFYNLRNEEKQDWVEQNEEIVNRMMQEILINKREEQSEQMMKIDGCIMSQSAANPNYMPQLPTPQKRLIIRQPTTPMNITPIPNMAPVNSIANMVSAPTIPSMGLTNPQPQFQQFNQIIPQMQNMMNRSQFMITTPPVQQFYPQSFVPRITRQMVSPQQQMIPSHMMAGAPQMLTQPQMLTPQMVSSQMVSPHCFGTSQFPQF